MHRPPTGVARGPRDRLSADELTEFSANSAGIVCVPDDATPQRPAPVIVVAPERYGLVQHTVDVANRFAAAGWTAVSPDFYAGVTDGEAGRLPELADESVLAGITAAVRFAGADERCDTTRVVVFGVCRSGSWGLLADAEPPGLAGVIMLYGGAQPKEYTQHARPYQEIIEAGSAPVLGIFGESDHTMSLDDVARLRAGFEQARRSYDIAIEPGLPHGWLNDTMPGRFRVDAAERTWSRMLGFLDQVREPAREAAVEWSFRARISPDYDFGNNVRHE
ncbi:MAG TPA: dienelactone hydrolase family protein [Jatrophihabitantaceae bacterium]|jgi:carboxymethylenebutenolidase